VRRGGKGESRGGGGKGGERMGRGGWERGAKVGVKGGWGGERWRERGRRGEEGERDRGVLRR